MIVLTVQLIKNIPDNTTALYSQPELHEARAGCANKKTIPYKNFCIAATALSQTFAFY